MKTFEKFSLVASFLFFATSLISFRFLFFKKRPTKAIVNGSLMKNGDLFHFKNGVYHREDGPAIIYKNGIHEWWIEGKRHRINGPAIENQDGSFFQYWLNGKQFFSVQEFKLEAFKIIENDFERKYIARKK